jgi:hypothetical protein
MQWQDHGEVSDDDADADAALMLILMMMGGRRRNLRLEEPMTRTRSTRQMRRSNDD